MRAKVLVDNISDGAAGSEWGLCVYIEYNGVKFLLDTGASGLFAENAEAFGINIGDVDMAILSHAHSDHANGMKTFFEKNSKASFYLQASARENCFRKKFFSYKYIGIARGTLDTYRDRIIFISGKHQLCDGVYLIPHTTPGLSRVGKREKMVVRNGRKWVPDDFSHEQSLVFDTEKGLVIFNSCSHGGANIIINEVRSAFPGKQVYALIGGFHLFNKTEAEVRALAGKIRDTKVQYICTGHCTGQKAYDILQMELGDTLHQLHIGLTMEF